MIYRIEYVGEGKQKRKLAHPVKDRQTLMALRNSKENLDLLNKARNGDAEAKGKLLQLAYNIGHVDGLIAGCKSQGSFFFHDVDCYDSATQTSDEIKNLILSKKDEIGLMMLERSVGGGWHLVCKREPGKTILENQVRVACALKLEMDTNTKDLQRVCFSTSGSEDDLVYLDDALFEEPMSPEACEKEYLLLKEREKKRLEEVPKGAKKANKHYRPWEDEGRSVADGRTRGLSQLCLTSQTPGDCPQRATETPETPNDRTRFIFRECMKEEDVTEADLVNEGGRHNSVKMILGVVNQLLTESETLGVLKELMPDNWNDDNIRQLVTAYYTDYYNPSQRLSLAQKRIFKESKRIGDDLNNREPSNISLTIPEQSSPTRSLSHLSPLTSNLSRLFSSKQPPEIPSVLPKLVKAVTCNTPQKLKATVAQAMFPPLAAYPKNLSFVYIDNQVRELRINCLIVAGTGTGKDMCTKQPLTHIIADMKERDELNRDRLKKFNEEYNIKAGNKQKPQRPADLVIQVIKSNITYAALVQRMDEAQGAPLYVRLNELEQWDKIEGCSGRNNQFTNLKLCDDEGNDFGADRASTQSVTGSGCLHLNWNANTTLSKVVRYFRHVMTDGPISRLCLATIPEEERGADIPVFGNYDEAYDAALKPFIDNLKEATGKIDCPQAKRLARKLKEECAEFARLSQDDVFDNLTHRALVAAFRKACLLYAANGMKWEKAIESFCRWSLFYDLYLKMMLFGDLIRHADADVQTSKRGPQSLLDLLPEEFSLEDAKRVRQQMGMDAERAIKMIRTWKSREYVFQISDFSFKKVSQQDKKKK